MSTEQEKNSAYENVDILYENNDIIFVKIYSLDAAKYFAPNYVADRYKYFGNGELFVIYDKNKDDKYVIHKPNQYDVNILDDNQYSTNVNELEEKYPFLEEIITNVYGKSSIYSALLMMSKGEKIDRWELSRLDDLVSDVRYNQKSPENSMITIKFDDYNSYFELFDLNEYDVSFCNRLFGGGYYSSENEFYYNDMGDSDWREGYLMYEFNQENLNKVKEMVTLLSPEISDMDRQSFNEVASAILYDTFNYEVDEIIYEYVNLKNQCSERSARKDIESELGDPFMTYGIFEKTPFRIYVTTIKVLLSLFKMSGKKNGSIKDVLSFFTKQKSVGPYEEYRFEFGCYDFDDESFQKEVEKQLEKMSEKLYDSDMFVDIEKYREIIKKVLSVYPINKTFRLPVDKEKTFRILKVDPKTNRIIVEYTNYKGLKGKKEKRSFSLEEFFNFLYTPELFEQKVLKFEKML